METKSITTNMKLTVFFFMDIPAEIKRNM